MVSKQDLMKAGKVEHRKLAQLQQWQRIHCQRDRAYTEMKSRACLFRNFQIGAKFNYLPALMQLLLI
jgi:hypothetical protein